MAKKIQTLEVRFKTLTLASSTKQTHLIYALYGVIELESQSYLLAVTKAEFAANIAGRNIYMAAEFKFVGLAFKETLEDSVDSL